MDNKEFIEYYEAKKNNDIDWQNTNAEDLLNFRKDSNEEDLNKEELNEEKVTLGN